MSDVIKGRGALLETSRSIDYDSWLILGGRTSFSSSGARGILDGLIRSGARVEFVEGPLPTVEEASRLVQLIRPHRPNGILAVGGGLVIDTMKAVALSLQTGLRVEDLFHSGDLAIVANVKTVAIPTTAGSGAERTPFAVIYRDGVKHSLDDPKLLPDLVVVDPSLMRSVPRRFAASAGLDALAHCVESMWACRSTPESRNLASRALASILSSLEPAVVKGEESAIDELAYAASDAGAAIATTRTTAAHALSYHLTSEYGIPHGHAVGLTLGPLLEVNGRLDQSTVIDERGWDHLQAVLKQVCALFGEPDTAAARVRLEKTIARLGLATKVDEATGRSVDRSRWLSDVNPERLANNPHRLTEEDLSEIVDEA